MRDNNIWFYTGLIEIIQELSSANPLIFGPLNISGLWIPHKIYHHVYKFFTDLLITTKRELLFTEIIAIYRAISFFQAKLFWKNFAIRKAKNQNQNMGTVII